MKIIIRITAFFLLMLQIGCIKQNPKDYFVELYSGRAHDLASAVQEENIKEIKKIVQKENVPVDTKDKRFGRTLLMWSVITDRPHSAKALLELGADPNLQDDDEKTSALIFAANKFNTSEFVKLLLAFGGDANTVSEKCLIYKCTPLIAASKRRLESVKLLVEAGADINYKTKLDQTALSAAITMSNIKIAHYLLLEKGAEFKNPVGETIDGDKIYVVDFLRRCVFTLGSEEHKLKMEVVEYLKKEGVDYSSTPIPKHYYKIYDSNFLDKY